MKLKAVVFDLDGTLLDTLDDLTAAVGHALGTFGYAAIEKSRVRRYVGNGVPKLIERALYFAVNGCDPDLDSGKFDDRSLFNACLAVFTEYYDKHSADLTKPYDGAVDMIKAVKSRGLKSAIVTNKYDGAAQALKVKFFGDVDIVVGAREGLRNKPAPDGVYKALETLGVGKDSAVYVGDGETDIATARNSGMPVIAVGWGFRDREVLEKLNPDGFIDNPDELMEAIIKCGFTL